MTEAGLLGKSNEKGKKMDILSRLKVERLYFDGGYGTLLQSKGLQKGELPEKWNITHPEIITDLHYEYLCSGADILKTNTFGANYLKYSLGNDKFCLENVISSAISNAKKAIKRYYEASGKSMGKYVALDIGPSGKLLEPIGDFKFEDAVSLFAETVRLGVKYGADLILIETLNDCYETKAAVIAAKENSALPVFVTNAYDEGGKLITGASPAAMVTMLEGLRVDALGINCSLGPEKMLPIAKELIECSSLPVIVNPNAGLPSIKDGETRFDVDAEAFSDIMVKMCSLGATVLGGCCGTAPTYIKKTREKTEGLPYSYPEKKNVTAVSSYTHRVVIGDSPVLIGERINPTGKSAFKKALREGDFNYILNEGIKEEEAGADILDVNVGLPEIDEKATLMRAVKELSAVTSLPLQIDTADAAAMEGAMRIYNGKPLVNSVNGKKESMDAVFPLVARYGGTLIALTLDENGIPDTAAGRVRIAKKIIKEAEKYGIEKKDIVVDPLAMTVSASPASALVTLEAVKKLSELGIKTSLGVSNVSFGLPSRNIINSTFFTMALSAGLNAAIMNPYSGEMLDAYYSYLALTNKDERFEKYMAYTEAATVKNKTEVAEKPIELTVEERLKRAVVKGLKEEASELSETLLTVKSPLTVINLCIVPALDEIGRAFESKKAFLPELLMSAEAAKAAFEVIKNKLSESGEQREKKYKIVIATVKGDVHDIGKNIVKVLLENYDYDVIDLGKDISPETVVGAALSEGARLVGLSALMTTTVPEMTKTVKLLREKAPDCKVMVGGAVLTEEYAREMGADKYAADAMEAVRYAEELL